MLSLKGNFSFLGRNLAHCLGLMTCYIGILLVAYFEGCDPSALGEITTPDQLNILMASRVLGKLPSIRNDISN